MRWFRISLILFLSSPLWAQHTTVTATILDPNGTPYVNCTGTANFIGQNSTPGAGPYTLGGGSFQTVVPIFCDSFGAFTVSLASNNVVTPTPSQWRFTITSATGYVPGNTYSFNTLITITGLTQDVSASLQAAAAILPTGGGGGGGPIKWNQLLPPNANLSMNTVLFTTTFTAGDFGSSPVNAGIWNVTDFSVSSTDTSTNFHVGTANNSFHQPFLVDLTTGGQTFAQLGVCDLGTGHVGITVVGNILPCLPNGSYPGLPGNTGVQGVSKLTVMDNSAQHTSIRTFQNNIVGTGGTLANIVEVNTAAVYNSPTLTFNLQTWCTGATQYNPPTTFGNGTCGGAFPGNILGSIRGDGTANFFNYIGPINGVTIAPPPLGATGYVASLDTQTTASWKPATGGGGGTGTQYQSAAFNPANVTVGYGPGIPGQTPVSRGTTNVPIFASAGVQGCNSGTGVVSTNTYTIAGDDNTAGVLDRLTTCLFTFSGTVTVTLAAPTASGFGSNFTIAIGASTGTTVNVTSSAAFVVLDGNTVGSSVSLTPGQYATVSSPNNTSWLVRKTYGIGPNVTLSGTLQAGTVKAALYQTTTNCSGVGTAANPSVVSCTAAPSGAFSCSTSASTGTCTVNTTAVTANSNIFVQPNSAVGARLSVTCNTTSDTGLTVPRLASISAGTSFTINLGTFSTNPECFDFFVVN